jgi:phosphopantothenate-cysteine ligase
VQPLNVLVTGGGTSAPIDDVRTVTNVSTGRFAAAISECCLARGARVWHVHAPSAQLPLIRQSVFNLETDNLAAELARLNHLRDRWLALRGRLHLLPLPLATAHGYAQSVRNILQTESIDVVFLAMAVSDYEPIPVTGKIDSRENDLIIRCVQTPKVIRLVRDWAPSVYLVGFKLLSGVATAELIRRAEQSRQLSRADVTVANDLQTLAAGAHTVHLVRQGHAHETLGPGPDLADRLVDRVFSWAAESR